MLDLLSAPIGPKTKRPGRPFGSRRDQPRRKQPDPDWARARSVTPESANDHTQVLAAWPSASAVASAWRALLLLDQRLPDDWGSRHCRHDRTVSSGGATVTVDCPTTSLRVSRQNRREMPCRIQPTLAAKTAYAAIATRADHAMKPPLSSSVSSMIRRTGRRPPHAPVVDELSAPLRILRPLTAPRPSSSAPSDRRRPPLVTRLPVLLRRYSPRSRPASRLLEVTSARPEPCSRAIRGLYSGESTHLCILYVVCVDFMDFVIYLYRYRLHQ